MKHDFTRGLSTVWASPPHACVVLTQTRSGGSAAPRSGAVLSRGARGGLRIFTAFPLSALLLELPRLLEPDFPAGDGALSAPALWGRLQLPVRRAGAQRPVCRLSPFLKDLSGLGGPLLSGIIQTLEDLIQTPEDLSCALGTVRTRRLEGLGTKLRSALANELL